METLQKIINKKYGFFSQYDGRIGGGYYADVFKFYSHKNEPFIVKVYKTKQIMKKEISQLEILKKYSLFPMPDILFFHEADEDYDKDFLVMSFLSGENAGNIFYITSSKRKQLAEQIVDNLIAFHSTVNPDGFGEIEDEKRYATFNEFYKIKAVEILGFANDMKEKGKLDNNTLEVMKKAILLFDKVFCFPITEARLIHGDYNTWNILADKKSCKVTAVIDPCGCMWADNEYDLYQLNNANGKHLKLLENYASKVQLSANHKEKMAFYELFTEIEHYYKSGYPIVKKLVKKQADQLNAYLENLI